MHQHVCSVFSTRAWTVAAAMVLIGSGARSIVQAADIDQPPPPQSELEREIAACSEAIRAAPGDAKAYCRRGRAYQRNHDFDKALADLTEAIRLDPKLAEAHAERGVVHWRTGRLDQCIADCTEAIKLAPKNADAYNVRGAAAWQNGDRDQAIKDYSQAIALDPKHAPAYNNRGVAFLAAGDLDKAAADFTEAIRIQPTYAEACYDRAVVEERRGQFDKAVEDLTAAVRWNPKYAEAFYRRGMAYRQQGKIEQAIADFSEAIRLNPHYTRAIVQRAAAYQRLSASLREKADADLAQVASLGAGVSRADAARVIADATAATRANPADAEAYERRALAYMEKGDLDRAAADCTEAIRLHPERAGYYQSRSAVYLRQQNLDKALADSNEAIRLAPAYAAAYGSRAVARFQKGEREQALADFDEAIRLDPQSADAYRNRATAYRLTGQAGKAAADLARAAALQQQRAAATGHPVVAGPPRMPRPRPEIVLANTRWQPLPSEVAGVCIGPDGRTWYEGAAYGDPLATAAEVEKSLAKELSQPAPWIDGCRLALLEPGGRVWFYLPRQRVLLAYDGKGWMEHPLADPQDQLVGRCETCGRLHEGLANRSAGGSQWFITSRGIHRFDGKDWFSREIGEDLRRGFEELLLAVSADGQTAAAIHRYSRDLWIFAAGQWQRGPLVVQEPEPQPPRPRGIGEPSPVRVRSIAIAPGPAVWIHLSDGRCRRFSREGKEQQTLPDGLQFERISELSQDPSGRIFIVSQDIGKGRPQGPGVAVLSADRHAELLPGKEFTAGWGAHFAGDVPAVLTASGKQVWLSFRALGEPARLLDLEKKQFVDTLPHDRCTLIHAVSGDGRVFASCYAKSDIGGGPVMVYAPGAPAAQRPLKVEHWLGSGLHLAVADDGAVWTEHQAEGLVRFDGRRWQPMGPKPAGDAPADQPLRRLGRRLVALLPGHDGAMLVCCDQEATLYRGATEVAFGETSTLIEQNPDKLRRVFDPKPLLGATTDRERAAELTADTAGNVWWRHASRLLVWTGGRWLNAHEALVAAGSQQGQVRWMCPAGDGSKLYVGDWLAPARQGRSFLGEVRDGRLQFTSAPNCAGDAEHVLDYVRDREGGVWVAADNAEPRPGWSGSPAVCIDQGGERQRLAAAAWPRLADAAGNVWLGALRYGLHPQDTLWVVRQGKIVQELRLPGRTFRDPMLSDRPGSVYVWTVAGLVHLTAEGPEYRNYRQAAVYPVLDVRGTIRSVAYTPHGYMAAVTFTAPPKREYHVYLVELPKE
jgi:tetratricopeptide (TPR) repeat protein